jgi:protein-L-isoaspartate(D-aspartate) O-methyltransferase
MYEDPLFPAWHEMALRMVEYLNLPEGPVAWAMTEVPRHRFLPRNLWNSAYYDTPLPVGPEATISAPHMVALQLEAIGIKDGHHILDIGSGSGYLAALAAVIGGPSCKVVGIEIETELAQRSRIAIEEIALEDRILIHGGDGAEGYPPDAPYDRIMVSYAVQYPFPEKWREQLKDDGVMVAPIDRGRGTYLEKLEKTLPKGWKVDRGPPCLFVASKP